VVIEDEEAIASAVAARLRSEGYEVSVAADGPSGIELVEREVPDLVVLDLMLPGIDGLEVCRRIQRDRRVPVLMLTARDTETDMLVGLGVGADDYMTKPFSPRELVARVQAILRRVEDASAPATTRLRVGDIEIELDTRRVRRGGDEGVPHGHRVRPARLPRAKPGAVLSREHLLAEVWGTATGQGPGRSIPTSGPSAASSATTSSAPCTRWATPWRTRFVPEPAPPPAAGSPDPRAGG
jgi:DNA-binding response OmpR family regulator